MVTGEAATVRWGYYDAAVLGPWTLEAGTLTAAVRQSDTFRLGQQPLHFVVSRPHGEWRWPVLTTSVTEGELTATLGPQEP